MGEDFLGGRNDKPVRRRIRKRGSIAGKVFNLTNLYFVIVTIVVIWIAINMPGEVPISRRHGLFG